MIYRFTSAISGETLMLEPHAKEVFEALQRDLGPRGVIRASDMEPLLRKLQAAIELSRQQSHEADKEKEKLRDAEGEEPEAVQDKNGPHVPFYVRAQPFYALLQTNQAAGEDITWGI